MYFRFFQGQCQAVGLDSMLNHYIIRAATSFESCASGSIRWLWLSWLAKPGKCRWHTLFGPISLSFTEMASHLDEWNLLRFAKCVEISCRHFCPFQTLAALENPSEVVLLGKLRCENHLKVSAHCLSRCWCFFSGFDVWKLPLHAWFPRIFVCLSVPQCTPQVLVDDHLAPFDIHVIFHSIDGQNFCTIVRTLKPQ